MSLFKSERATSPRRTGSAEEDLFLQRALAAIAAKEAAEEQDEDEELKAALELSAREAAINLTAVLNLQQTERGKRHCLRSTLKRVDKHFLPAVASQVDAHGHVFQLGVLNQFHRKYCIEVPEGYHGPASTCGFFSCAYATLLERFLLAKNFSSMLMTQADVDEMIALLVNEEQVDPLLHRAFEEIQARRRAFFAEAGYSEEDIVKRLKNWVANYEIADYLSRHATSASASASAAGGGDGGDSEALGITHFVRCNQFPKLYEAVRAYPDEVASIQREAPFGGEDIEENGTITFGEGSSEYFVQTKFSPATQGNEFFLSPEEWTLKPKAQQPHVCVLDLDGHFVTAVVCQVAVDESGEWKEGEEVQVKEVRNVVFVINTTEGSYLNYPTVVRTFDAFFSSS